MRSRDDLIFPLNSGSVLELTFSVARSPNPHATMARHAWHEKIGQADPSHKVHSHR